MAERRDTRSWAEVSASLEHTASVWDIRQEILGPALVNLPVGISNWQDVAAAHDAILTEPRTLVLPPSVFEAAAQVMGLNSVLRKRPLTDAELDELEEFQRLGLEWRPDDNAV